MLTWVLTLSKVSTILKREAVPHESPFECSFYNSSNRDAWNEKPQLQQINVVCYKQEPDLSRAAVLELQRKSMFEYHFYPPIYPFEFMQQGS